MAKTLRGGVTPAIDARECIDGSEMCASQICLHLNPLEYDPMIGFIYPNRGPMTEYLNTHGVRHCDLNRSRLNRIVWPILAAWKLRRLGIELIHVHHLAFLPLMHAVARWAGISHVVFTEHSIFGHEHSGSLRRLMPRIPELASVSTAVSRKILTFLTDKAGLPRKSITYIPNGVDIEQFSPRKKTGVLRQLIRADRGETVLMAVGRLTDAKNYPMLLEVADRLRDRNFRLAVVGDGELRDSIADEIRRRKLEQHVYLLGGRTDVHDLLPDADCFVLTSKHEGLPIAILEAMACGLPIVATAVGGIGEIIRNGENGILVSPNNAPEFADTLSSLFRNTQMRDSLGQRARETVIRDYSWKRISREYEEIYQRLARAEAN